MGFVPTMFYILCTLFQMLHTHYCGSCSYLISSVKIDSSRIWNDPFDSAVRLSNGNFVNEGLLEVYCNDKWGTVCNKTFSSTSTGTTACRQLGYHSFALTDGTNAR